MPVQTAGGFQAGNPTKLFELRNVGALLSARHYDVSRDGQRFVIIKEAPADPASTAAPASLVVVLNWSEELKTKVGK